MAVPEFQKFMLPIMKLHADNTEHSVRDCVEEVINYFKLSENEIKELVPSGKQTLVINRVYWSLTYLKKSLLLESSKRGIYKITSRGQKLLKTNPDKIDKKLLSQYNEYLVFSNQVENNNADNNIEEETTPEESVGKICAKLKEQLADDLLEMISQRDPYYFERLVIDVLLKMGYGDFRPDAGRVTSKSNDEGIDGIIDQDKLGLEKVYIQAKRWKSTIGRTELQNFVGALSATKSNKGIFITTSDFNNNAKNYVSNLSQSIKLINGKELANYMIDYNVGVQVDYSYEIKKIDNDYFEML